MKPFLPIVRIEKRKFFSFAQGTAMREKLLTCLKETQPNRKQGIQGTSPSKEMVIPVYPLSAYINQEFAKNFKDWITESRIRYAANAQKHSEVKTALTLDRWVRKPGSTQELLYRAVKNYGPATVKIFRV